MREVSSDLRARIAHALGEVPKLRSRGARDALIEGLPRPLMRDDNPATDFIFIVDRLADEGVDADGRVALLVALDRALAVAGADSRAGRSLRAMHDALGVEPAVELPRAAHDEGFEAMPYDGVDTRQSIDFFDSASRSARSVARLKVPKISGTTPAGAEFGTGWLLAPQFLLTNHHVIEARVSGGLPRATPDEIELQAKKAVVWFDYYSDAGGVTPHTGDARLLARETHDSDGLDYALLLLEAPQPGEARPFLKVAARAEEIAPGTRLNIIQHSNGLPMQFAFRNNFFVRRLVDKPFLRYLTETQPGASGSPVFNDRWQVVALHHAWRPADGALPNASVDLFKGAVALYHNEGIAIHAVLDDLRSKAARGEFDPAHLDTILRAQGMV